MIPVSPCGPWEIDVIVRGVYNVLHSILNLDSDFRVVRTFSTQLLLVLLD